MKKHQLTVGTPHNGTMQAEYAISLFALASHPELEVSVKLEQSAYIHRNRNKIINTFLGDWLLFVDNDISFQPDDVLKLIALDRPISAGVYCDRHSERGPMVLEFYGEERLYRRMNPEHIFDHPFKVDGMTTGFMLIKREAAKHILRHDPTPFDFDGIDDGGEDVSFCRVCKSLGVEIWCHPGVKVGHIGTKMY